MKIVLIMLLTVASSFFLTNTALAQNKPLACQEEAMAGLKWENGKWSTKTFISDGKFILVQTKDGLTADSVAKAVNTFPDLVSCRNEERRTSCQDQSGGNLYFDPMTLKGGISQLLGATSTGTRRDTVTATVFSCTPF